ncbi:MAG: nucleoside triphosphate pyrophosphohydrolase [Firmicutes bacterium]|nr:nucleoside triphosphate pyrophosphohydrolase [Bacillota bacterium]
MERVVEILRRLRGPGGCPWDRQQTHESLRRYVIEEAYEVVTAIDSGDAAQLKEELGDLLLQVVFHSVIAEEAGAFDWRDVAHGLAEKLVRRHPHVFGGLRAATAEDVHSIWQDVKAAERAAAGEPPARGRSRLDEAGRGQPALLAALSLSRAAAALGFDWPDAAAVLEKVREEMAELEAARRETPERVEEEFGDLLFALVNYARWLGVDPELALHRANTKFRTRFARMENAVEARGETLEGRPAAELDALWEQAKRAAGASNASADASSASNDGESAGESAQGANFPLRTSRLRLKEKGDNQA